MGKFSKAPGQESSQKSADDFIEEANERPAQAAGSFPWEGLDDKRRRSGFNLRFTDAELAKLKFIAENTPHSMHEFCLRAVQPVLEAKIAELIRPASGKREG